MSIELNDVSSGFNLNKINENFKNIEEEFNVKVLRRDGLDSSEDNQMNVNLDMNSNRIYNLPTPVNSLEPVRLLDLSASLQGYLGKSLDEALQELIEKYKPKSYLVPPFTGSVITLDEPFMSLRIEVNGRVLPDSEDYYTIDKDTNTIILTSPVDKSDIVVLYYNATIPRVSRLATPRDYGAIGDGITDDTDALKAWAEAEDVYYLGDYTYYYTDTITVQDKPNARWIPSNGKLKAEVYNKPVFEFINCPDIVVEGFDLDMSLIDTNNQDIGFQNGLLFSACPRGVFRLSKLDGAPSQALNVRDRSTGFYVGFNRISNSGRLQQINPGTGISIGGAIISFNNSNVCIESNMIDRSWSAAIVCYSDVQEGGSPVDYEATKQTNIRGNFIYGTQSNAIRVQPDNYPAADLVHDVNIHNNIAFNAGRTCIRANGIRISVLGNIVGYDLKPIYGSTTDLPNNGLASNHCKDSLFANNIVLNCAAGFEAAPNSLSEYGIEDTDVYNNIFVNCPYSVYRSGDLTAKITNLSILNNKIKHGGYVTVEGGTSYPAREAINLRNCDDVIIGGNKIKGRSEEFELSASISLLDCGEVLLLDNKTYGASSSVRAENCTTVISEGNDFDNNYSGVALINCDEFIQESDRIKFNSIQTTNTVGVGLDKVGVVQSKSNKFYGDASEVTSAYLLANTIDSEVTKGVISGNFFDTDNGVNNQIVGGEEDGKELARFNNLHYRNFTYDNVKCLPVESKADSVTLSGSDNGSNLEFNANPLRSVAVPDGLPIGFSFRATNLGGGDVVINLGTNTFLTGDTSVQAKSVSCVKLSDTRWVAVVEHGATGTFQSGTDSTVTVVNGIITDLGE